MKEDKLNQEIEEFFAKAKKWMKDEVASFAKKNREIMDRESFKIGVLKDQIKHAELEAGEKKRGEELSKLSQKIDQAGFYDSDYTGEFEVFNEVLAGLIANDRWCQRHGIRDGKAYLTKRQHDEAVIRELQEHSKELEIYKRRFEYLEKYGLPFEHCPEPINYPAYVQYFWEEDGERYDSLTEAVDAELKEEEKWKKTKV